MDIPDNLARFSISQTPEEYEAEFVRGWCSIIGSVIH